ncbi:uncharacterized protein VTP21DRAFT_3208 [Calcarisporiella thermophila]|uniref:uncharacterized protein n=1 Tax=Calcarisporiella thermophila TaxID=911321 RepID=UPI003743907B
MPKPPGFPCHEPHYDEGACQLAKLNRNNSFWRSDHVGAMQKSSLEMDGDRGCALDTDKNTPCLQGSVPVYAVNVSNVEDIKKTVVFAAEKRLRLVVKSSGHGRSTASGALSIWTHYFRNITFHDQFTPENCKNFEPHSAITVEAGVQFGDVYRAAGERGLVVVGGSSQTVGAAGAYVQGGGHSAISPLHGLGSDNVLEYKVVTADGKLRTANSCQNKDLFWALRGGGGGTFGVVVSATLKTYKEPNGVIAAFYGIQTNDTASTRDLTRELMRLQPSMSDAGWAGYFYIMEKMTAIAYLNPIANMSQANSSFSPLVSFANNHQGLSVLFGNMFAFPNYTSWYFTTKCMNNTLCTDPVGGNAASGSRLIPRSNFETDDSLDQLSDTLIKVLTAPLTDKLIIGHLVAGGAVARNNNNETSVNPAWRKALLHVIMVSSWEDNATMEEIGRRNEATTRATQLLKDITPDSGCYINESDPNDPEWQKSYFGANYPRLKAIKNSVDPQGLFTCWHCVGSEDWTDDLNCSRT